MKYTLPRAVAFTLLMAITACSAENTAQEATDYQPPETQPTEIAAVAEDTAAEDAFAEDTFTEDVVTEDTFVEGAVAEDQIAQDQITGPSTIAALVYADWCSSCKILDPAIQSARTANEFDGIEFVTLDYTARDSEAFFASADEAGIGAAVRDRLTGGVTTGLLLVIDTGTGEIVTEMTKADTATAIAEKLNAL